MKEGIQLLKSQVLDVETRTPDSLADIDAMIKAP